jgi:hypothetical protein
MKFIKTNRSHILKKLYLHFLMPQHDLFFFYIGLVYIRIGGVMLSVLMLSADRSWVRVR